MLKTFKSIVILSLWVSVGNADSDQSTQNMFLYIDKLHSSISQTVVEWSDIIDTTLSKWLEENITNTTDLDDNRTKIEANITDMEGNSTILDTNVSQSEGNATIFDTNPTDVENNTTIHERTKTSVKLNTNKPSLQTRVIHRDTTAIIKHTDTNETSMAERKLEKEVDAVDRFFQNDKYLDQTEETFIRIRSENYFESKGSNDFGVDVRVQLPLSKTKKRFKIFMDNLTLDNADNLLKDTQETPDIGIHYFASREKILSRYSIGLSGIHPFVTARFNMSIDIDNWLINPIQTFRYSTNNQFEEETNIYADRKISPSSIFRILLHRKTQDEIDGMDYALSIQCFKIGKKDTGFGLAQSFFGNTKYTYSTEQGTPQQYGGINDYVTTFSWRANIWRKWFYYEVRPSVSFQKQYAYEPNYSVRFFFDFYFGHHHKN